MATRTPTSPRAGADVLAVVNGAASRAGDGPALLERVCGELRSAGARAEGVVTRTEAELRDALEGADGRRVALVGGDGTLHAAVNQPLDRLPELAVVPVGRANNVARALGVPVDLREAARIAAGAQARPLDVLRVETASGPRYCLESLSAGLQADARSRYSAPNSADLRGGARALAAAVRDFHPYEVDVVLDGAPAYDGTAAQVFFANLPYFGFGFRVDPVARPADGLLEAIVLPAESRIDVARLLLSVYRGTHLRRRDVRLERAHEAVLTGPLPLAGDGTPLGTGSAKVSVERGRLRVAAP